MLSMIKKELKSRLDIPLETIAIRRKFLATSILFGIRACIKRGIIHENQHQLATAKRRKK